MVLDEAAQWVYAVCQVLIAVARGIYIVCIYWVVKMAGQLIEGTHIALSSTDSPLLELGLINRVWLNEQREAILFRVRHPCHLVPSVALIIVLGIGLGIPFRILNQQNVIVNTCSHKCVVEDADA